MALLKGTLLIRSSAANPNISFTRSPLWPLQVITATDPQHTRKTHTRTCIRARTQRRTPSVCVCLYTLEPLLTCAREQPQEVGRSSVNKQRAFRKTLHSPEHRFGADVENNGHFWAQAWHANVPQQTTFLEPLAWISRNRLRSQKTTAIQHWVTFSQKQHMWLWKPLQQ